MMAKSGKSMVALATKRFQIWRSVVTIGDFVRGSVVVLRRPCRRDNCRLCREGKRHPATYLSMKEKGRTRLVYLTKERVPHARKMVHEWKRLEKLLREMSDTNAEMLRLRGKRDTAERRKSS